MVYSEGMGFYVTAAQTTDLENWLSGGWVLSRIVERHLAYAQARAAVSRRNQEATGGGDQFYFVTSDRDLTG